MLGSDFVIYIELESASVLCKERNWNKKKRNKKITRDDKKMMQMSSWECFYKRDKKKVENSKRSGGKRLKLDASAVDFREMHHDDVFNANLTDFRSQNDFSNRSRRKRQQHHVGAAAKYWLRTHLMSHDDDDFLDNPEAFWWKVNWMFTWPHSMNLSTHSCNVSRSRRGNVREVKKIVPSALLGISCRRCLGKR